MPRGPTINGGGISLSDTEEETDEEDGETEFVSTSEQITQEADPETFDRTFLAQAEDWKLGGPFSSPAPFPLQVVPRMAYVINYSYVYNSEKDRWEPQKKDDPVGTGGVTAVFSSGSNQTISGTSLSKIKLDTTEHDERDEFNTATNEIDVDRDGFYYLAASADLENASDGDRIELSVRVNGSREADQNITVSDPGGINPTDSAAPTKVVRLDENDSIDLAARELSGGSLNVAPAGNNTWLSVVQIG